LHEGAKTRRRGGRGEEEIESGRRKKGEKTGVWTPALRLCEEPDCAHEHG
jgi:hypothetical protein